MTTTTNSVEGLSTLRLERRGAAAWIILTRPERRNALSAELIEDLKYALDLARDPSIRVVVLTGTEDAFCAGADLEFVRSLDGPAEVLSKFLRPLTQVLAAIRELPKPVIAAINGHCVAGGLETALCCDLIVATEDAKIADGHSRLGLLPAIGGASLLSRSVGLQKAKEMLFTGDSFTGAQLAELGLVNRAIPRSEFEETVTELVEQLCSRSPSGLARMKQMVNEGAMLPWSSAAKYELALTESHLASGAHEEGLQAFLEGRPPTFIEEQ